MKKCLFTFMLMIPMVFFSQDSINIILREKAVIRDSPLPTGKIIDVLEVKTNAVGYDLDEDYLKVKYNNKIGFINSLWIEANPNFVDYITLKKTEIKSKYELESKQKEAYYIKKFGKKKYEDLISGKYWIGMTAEMALLSLGTPKKINESVGSWGTHQQWVYDNRYLYFENGILKSYQN
ncbi:hypothetical protein ABE425_04595 [Chryseobacterium cucumeris]|uniref:hypothetical protein n=1 Tax=Chryseobacterium cucumeris TaxID=1813611 RepID=UPI003209FE19